MAEKKQYRTRQKGEILAYLQTIPGQHITAAEICRHFRENGQSIGTATVYRQLEHLIGEGLVNKYIVDEGSSACFEYIDPARNCHRPSCYHCKCERCGRLFHVSCEEIAQLQVHMEAEHGFRIDPQRTVFYGICAECRGE